MKLFIRAAFWVLISFTFNDSLYAQSSYNLDLEKINPSTQLPSDWIASTPAGFKLSSDSQTIQHGLRSLLLEQLTSNKDFGLGAYTIIPGFGGKNLTLTGYLKTEDVKGSAGLWIQIMGKQNSLAMDTMNGRSIRGTTAWTKYKIELEYDEQEAIRIELGCYLTGGGKVWMDNLELTIDGVPIEKASPKKPFLNKAVTDTVFNNGSGINQITLNKQLSQSLVNLGQLWGFLKYHHPAVARGDYNWDAELFRILPAVLATKTKSEADVVLEKWVDGLGKPDKCIKCTPVKNDSTVKLLPDYGSLFSANNFQKNLIEKLDYIKNNRNQGKSYYIAMMQNVGNPEFKNENPYPKMKYPDAGYRLLALYRYWNMIQYFFPYKHLIGEDWNKVLPEFIPAFVNAKDSADYSLACLQIIARIHDTHANIYSNIAALNNYYGKYFSPLQTKFIENKLVVTGYYLNSDSLQQLIKKGDIISKINKEKTEDVIKKWLPLTPASNYETQLRDIPSKILRGQTDSILLEIDREGKKIEIPLKRYESSRLRFQIDYATTPDSFKVINGNIGYVYPGKYKNRQLAEIKKQFSSTTGIIVDMRCYPSEFMPFTFGNYINPRETPFVKFTQGSINTPGLFTYSSAMANGGTDSVPYKGKIVVIVNATSQSQAEYTTMAFQSAPDVTVIGSITAGADGNVSTIYLPGNIYTLISGIGVLYPDGTETQRVGVKIDLPMKPTIKGLKEGRDELLEKAIEIIQSSAKTGSK